jgi:selenocysteine lyase/cysteine desulfurase
VGHAPRGQSRSDGRPRGSFDASSIQLGLINPAKEICALARTVGACTVIDGAQGAPHARIDVQSLGCDF